MPATARALTRAARARAEATDVPYTEARDIEIAIRARISEHGEDYQTAAARITPQTTEMCEDCGWTYAMVCPECPGCGCHNHQCSGWRHREFMHPDERSEVEAAEAECPECGGDTRTGYDCHCDELAPAGRDDQDDEDEDEDRRTDLAIQAWKDDRAMGYIDRDGNPLDQDPPEPDHDDYPDGDQ